MIAVIGVEPNRRRGEGAGLAEPFGLAVTAWADTVLDLRFAGATAGFAEATVVLASVLFGSDFFVVALADATVAPFRSWLPPLTLRSGGRCFSERVGATVEDLTLEGAFVATFSLDFFARPVEPTARGTAGAPLSSSAISRPNIAARSSPSIIPSFFLV